jgi:hypothetical protein
VRAPTSFPLRAFHLRSIQKIVHGNLALRAADQELTKAAVEACRLNLRTIALARSNAIHHIIKLTGEGAINRREGEDVDLGHDNNRHECRIVAHGNDGKIIRSAPWIREPPSEVIITAHYVRHAMV